MLISDNTHIAADLRVDGWLEAPNIRGFLKGIFPTSEALCNAYPRPHTGWCALVGTALPADVYIAAEGTWHPSGGRGGSPVIIDSPLATSLKTESAVRQAADDRLAALLQDTAGIRIPSYFWIPGQYIDPQGTLKKENSPIRLSTPIQLQRGDCLVYVGECNSGYAPIALMGDDASGGYIIPIVGEYGSGTVALRYTAVEDTQVRVTTHGPSTEVWIHPRREQLVVTSLLAVNGIRLNINSSGQGARLLPDGSVRDTAYFGATDFIRVEGLFELEYQGMMNSDAGVPSAFANFYDADRELLKSHCSGSGASDQKRTYHNPGTIRTRLRVPDGAVYARFSSMYKHGSPTGSPLFDVRSLPSLH